MKQCQFFFFLESFASFEQVSADFPEQQEDFPSLFSAVLDFEEQQDADDLPFPPLSAESFEEQQAAPFLPLVLSPSAQVDASDDLAALPPRLTLFAEEPASFV